MLQTDLTNHFLIAMPNLKDPNFERTVTYICTHNEKGAMGIVINKPLSIELGDIFKQLDIPVNNTIDNSKQIFRGGPVQANQGFILHQKSSQWDSSVVISDEMCLTTSRDILEAIAIGAGPTKSLIAFGYAGWGEGQLEQELMDIVWLSGPAALEIIFTTPFDQCWRAAADHLGIDVEKLSTDIGHA